MGKRKNKKLSRGHIFNRGGFGLPAVNNSLSGQTRSSGLARPYFEKVPQVSEDNTFYNYKDTVWNSPAEAQQTPGIIPKKSEAGKSANTGKDFMSGAQGYFAMAKTFDSIASSAENAIDSTRRGYSETPDEIRKGILGDSDAQSHLERALTTKKATDNAVNYALKRGNVEYAATNNADLLSQRTNERRLGEANINLRGKGFQEFVFDPGSFIFKHITRTYESPRKRQERVNRGIRTGNIIGDKAYADAVGTVSNNQYASALENYSSAFGGPLFSYDMFSSGASAYDVAKDNAYAKMLNAQNDGIRAFTPGFNTSSNDAFANGGLLSNNFTNGVTLVNEGGTHENNPYEGVQMGIAPDGKPNLVEEGEAIFNNYVFSNRLKVPKAVRNKYKLRGPKKMTFAEAFRKAQKESEERPNDPISQDGLENIAMILARTQEAVRGYEKNRGHKAAKGGHLYALPAAYTGAVLSDAMGWTNRRQNLDYISPFRAVDYNPVGQYAPITHFDTRYEGNLLSQDNAATVNALRQSTAPGTPANIIAASYAGQIARANADRTAAMQDYDNLLKGLAFNRATDETNSRGALQAGIANMEGQLKYDEAAMQQAIANINESNATAGAKAANIGNLAEALDDIARERDAYNWRDMLLRAGVYGPLSEKPTGWTDDEWNTYIGLPRKNTSSKKTSKRKKKGLTY